MTPQLSADEVAHLKTELDNFKARSKGAKATTRGPIGSPEPEHPETGRATTRGVPRMHRREILICVVCFPEPEVPPPRDVAALRPRSLIRFGIPTPTSTPKRLCCTSQRDTDRPIIPAQEFRVVSGRSPEPITPNHSVGKGCRDKGEGKGKRRRSMSSDGEVEIVSITKCRRKYEGSSEGESDIVCVGHTLDLTL
jgi:hypothetical protein